MERSRPTPLYFRQLARAPLVQSAPEPAVLPGHPCIKHPKKPWPLPTLFPFTQPGGYFLCGVLWDTPIHSGLSSNHMARAPPVLSIQGHSAFIHFNFRWPVRAPSEWRAPGQASLQSLSFSCSARADFAQRAQRLHWPIPTLDLAALPECPLHRVPQDPLCVPCLSSNHPPLQGTLCVETPGTCWFTRTSQLYLPCQGFLYMESLEAPSSHPV